MNNPVKKKLRAGIAGTIVAALCCFTPILVIGLGAAGLTAWLGWVDYILFPVMFASLGLVAHTLYLSSGKAGPKPNIAILFGVIGLSAFLIWVEFRFALRISIAAMLSVAAYAYYLRRAATRSTSAASEENKLEQQS